MPATGNDVWWSHTDLVGEYNPKVGGTRHWRCIYCNVIKKSSADRVRAHLLGEKGHGTKPCEAIPMDVKNSLLELYGRPHSNSKTPPTVTIPSRMQSSMPMPSTQSEYQGNEGMGSNSNAPGASSSGHLKPGSLEHAWHPGRKAIVDGAVGRFFWGCNIPFNVARSPHWKNLLQEVGVYGPNYKSPTPDVLGGKLML